MSQKRHRSPYANAGEARERQSQPYIPRYEYDTLHPRHIRLLVLDPGSEDDELSGTLYSVSLEDNPVFSAISYTWGEPIFSETLRLSGRMMKITHSLAGALRRFRHPDTPVRLWADGVCIDQDPAAEDGFSEKNHQVKMMGEIYSGAEEVLIWLGEAEARDTIIFRILSMLSNLSPPLDPGTGRYSVTTAIESVRSMPWPGPKDHTKVPIECRCCHHLVHVQAYSWFEALETFVDFWDKPWFSRLWVLQEASLAKSATVFCGTHQLSLAGVTRAYNFLYWFLIEHPSLHDRFEGIDIFDLAAFDIYTGNDVRPMLEILEKTHQLVTKVPHDHLFALRGLSRAIEALTPSPDYTVPHDRLFKNVSASLLTSRKSWCRGLKTRDEVTRALARACARRLANDDLLPSWTLFLVPTEASNITARDKVGSVDTKFAAGGMMHDAYLPRRTGQDELRFRGRRLGELDDILRDSSMPALFDSSGSYLNRVLPQWIKRCGEFVKACNTEVPSLHISTMMNILLPHVISGHDLRTYVDSIRGMFSVDDTAFVDGSTRDFQACSIKDVSFNGDFVTTEQVHNVTAALWFHRNNDAILAKCSDGRFCWVPPASIIGDCVCLLSGATVPFMLRPKDESQYRLIGDVYMHGVMYGEAWPETVQEEEDRWETRSSISFSESDIDNGEAFYDPREDENELHRNGNGGLLEDFLIV